MSRENYYYSDLIEKASDAFINQVERTCIVEGCDNTFVTIASSRAKTRCDACQFHHEATRTGKKYVSKMSFADFAKKRREEWKQKPSPTSR